METVDESYFKDRVYVSTVAWVSAIFSGIIIYFSLFALLNLFLFQQNPMIQDFPLDKGSDTSQLFDKTHRLLLIVYGLGAIMGVIFLTSSIGLMKTRNWARKTFILISWIMICTSIIAVVTYIAFSGKILSHLIDGNFPSHEFTEMTAFMKKIISVRIVGFGILLIVFIRTLFQIVRRLTKNSYKILFR